MIVFKKLQQIKEMITQLVVCQTTIVSKILSKVIFKIIPIGLGTQQAIDADPVQKEMEM